MTVLQNIEQSGNDNRAITYQRRDGTGGDSNITITQSGSVNNTETNQYGVRHSANVTQSGFEGDANNMQYGEDNAVTVTQSGEFNESDILQETGSVFNVASVTQSGFGVVGAVNQATISQYGSNDTATIMQSGGSGNMATITQY